MSDKNIFYLGIFFTNGIQFNSIGFIKPFKIKNSIQSCMYENYWYSVNGQGAPKGQGLINGAPNT